MAHMSTTIKNVLNDVKQAIGGLFPSRSRFPQYWERIPAVAAVQHSRECGGDTERYANLFDYALKRWGSRLPTRPLSALVIGCSRKPELPRWLLATGRIGKVLVVDNDSVVLENLLEQRLPNVECWQMELNADPLPRGPFDLIACWDALNHMRELEHIGGEIEKVLERSGLFIAREYIGPNRLQFPPGQMGLVNAFLQLLPEKWRLAQDMEEPLEQQFAPDLADMMRLDPSKAVRSKDIEKMLHLRLRMLEEIPLGGTLLSPLLANISACFSESSSDSDRILQTLLDVEMRLITGGLIDSDYKAFIARLY